MASLSQILDWFKTGKKPTQAQFWTSWGSFWHKEEIIPQSAISNLTTVLNAKAEKAQFDAHKTDENAHTGLFAAKEDKTQKGVAGGYVPLDEFSKIAHQFLSIVNNLTTGGTMSLLSAEQGVVLQTQIDAINTLLTSDDINLDTVQELVDAIKTVETSLETILVDDLTTGGTTKALTAEMGKSLKSLIDGKGIYETTGDFSNIQNLINNNLEGATINLKPNHIYAQDNSLIMKKGITINGNGATLKRSTEQATTITTAVTQASTIIKVFSIPLDWKAGDYLQLYTDDTYFTSSYKYEIIIESIVGNTINLSQPIGRPAQGMTRTWQIGTNIRKVFSQITAKRSKDLFTEATSFYINNLKLDGNVSGNSASLYWGVNMAFQNNGRAKLTNVSFLNMPNECVFGTGFSLYDCYAENLNGSFIHQSGDINEGEKILGGVITGCKTYNTNKVSSNLVNGHNEGVVTFSFTSGRINIHNNRFIKGGESVLGVVSYGFDPMDGSNKDFNFNNNYCEEFTKAVSYFNWANNAVRLVENMQISNNVFSNCGDDDWGIYQSNVDAMGDIKFINNLLTNGTVISNVPQKMLLSDPQKIAIRAVFTDANLVFDNTELAKVRYDHFYGGANLPSLDYWSLETRRNENTSSYGVQIATGWGPNNTNKMFIRSVYNGVWTGWVEK